MAYHFNDNVYTKFFTPREYQVELLDAAKERNIIVCLGTVPAKIFIATKLIQELANVIRKPLGSGGKRTLYLLDSPSLVSQQASYIRHLTDLTVGEYGSYDDVEMWELDDWEQELSENQVLVMTSKICLNIMCYGYLQLSDLNLIVLDECHRAIKDHPMRQIMREYLECAERPKVLGLTAPLLNSTCDPSRLEGEIRRLETVLHSTAETASDIVSVLRYCQRPKELLLECQLHTPGDLDAQLEVEVSAAMEFLNDHRYDPTEVYEDEFQEELRGIPDPKLDPENIFRDFLNVLRTLGAWAADRAALALLIQLEKLKVKTPYERHFLLLCMVTSTMVKIRAICDHTFQDYGEKERIYKFSSPKVLRLLDILRLHKPEKLNEEAKDGDGSSQEGKAVTGSDLKGCSLELDRSQTSGSTEKSIEDCTVEGSREIKMSGCDSTLEVVDPVNGSLFSSDSTTRSEIIGCGNFTERSNNQVSISSIPHCNIEESYDSAAVNSDECINQKNKCQLMNGYIQSEVCQTGVKAIADSKSHRSEVNVSSVINDCSISKHVSQSSVSDVDKQVNCVCVKQCLETGETLSTQLSHANEKFETNNSEIPQAAEPSVHDSDTSESHLDEDSESSDECTEASESSEMSSKEPSSIGSSHSSQVAEDNNSSEGGSKPQSTGCSNEVSESNTNSNDSSQTSLTENSSGLGDREVDGLSDTSTRPTSPASLCSESIAAVSTSSQQRSRSTSECSDDTTEDSECIESSRDTSVTEPTACSEKAPVKGLHAEESETDALEVVDSSTDSCSSSPLKEKTVLLEGILTENCSQGDSTLLTAENCIKKVSLHERVTEDSITSASKTEQNCVVKVEEDSDSLQANSGLPSITQTICTKDVEGSVENESCTSGREVAIFVEAKAATNGSATVGQGPHSPSKGRLDFVPRSRGAKYARRLHQKDDAGRRDMSGRPHRGAQPDDGDTLCGIVFVEHRFTAKILYHLLNELHRQDEDFTFLAAQYTVDKVADPIEDAREAEIEHHKQEEVLKRFRVRECNLLVGTSVLEEGIDVPKCNLVVRFDPPSTYRSYVQSKGRARAQDAHYMLMVEKPRTRSFIKELAQYFEIEQMLLRKCANREPPDEEECAADTYSGALEPFQPAGSEASVSLATAVALVNRYCAKLPSDTFTRLTPLWSVHTKQEGSEMQYVCTVRLPINSPVKRDIEGPAMPSCVLARRAAALETCRALHAAGELDDNLLPVGKESFRLREEEEPLEEEDLVSRDPTEPRPGTTKRRQYYYKRIADALTDCRPVPGHPALLYHVSMVLTCPLPEEQNTRGRKIYPPEESPQGFGILTLREIPKICPFPIFTRSGEVSVTLELSGCPVVLTEEKLEKIVAFLNYTFTSVLRLQKYLMMFDPEASENSYFIVPTKKYKDGIAEVDWEFLNLIYESRDLRPHPVPEEQRAEFTFDAAKYHDAVIMPWYRNQDQPQYFYVAEICSHLNPKSSFPGSEYKTFDEYYFKKYNIQIQNSRQPLLDVDHTSARLNFLTPRYVNRKGVALPTSSEETKRAKRENLEQKQILVPELCTVHPFPASLWRKAVCLPCILYRVNALLLADQIRRQVAASIALGREELDPDFEWPPLDFGWSLADVLKKSKETAKSTEQEKELQTKKEEIINCDIDGSSEEDGEGEDEDDPELEEAKERGDWLEIGTWSNDMASQSPALGDLDLPPNVTLLGGSWGVVRYGSPSSWLPGPTEPDGCDSDSEVGSEGAPLSEASDIQGASGIRIEFKSDNVAEAIEEDGEAERRRLPALGGPEEWEWDSDCDEDSLTSRYVQRFQAAAERYERHIESLLVPADQPLVLQRTQMMPSSLAADPPGPLPPRGPLSPQTTAASDSGVSVDGSSDYGSECSDGTHTSEDSIGKFSFDAQPDLRGHPGPSPSVILQALTMSNANDGINLERLETIGDSFLKYAITTYLYCTYDNIHEGKLSHLRSKQVSNLHLYRLGRRKVFGESMIATKFEPHDNWLPPCYYVPRELEQALIEAGVPASHWNQADLPAVRTLSRDQICELVRERSEKLRGEEPPPPRAPETLPCFVPYNLITQHSIPDKSVADCVEALIGAYLIACGPRGALLFMAWLGICVLPRKEVVAHAPIMERPVGSLVGIKDEGSDPAVWKQVRYGTLKAPRSPLLRNIPNPEDELQLLLDGYDTFERRIGYHFQDRSYLLQSLTHASYSPNRLTDCYQRLEFLGDAVLDYLITRHLYEDSRQHSPGALTDLRSALVNNTIFASLAVRYGFHKYFRHLSPGLSEVVDRFVRIQEENGHTISEEYYLIEEEECEEAEDVEVPKALGDVFESVAGAIFLDSGMSLDAVWQVYYRMMRAEIEQFSTNVPKSPIRELLELEPETAKFGKPEKLADGRRVRVTVEVFGKGTFKGIGRNYRIAKCTAAKCALKQLKKKGLLSKKM